MRLRYSASISFLFAELPFLDRFAAARDAGFEGVEIQFLPDLPVERIAAAVRRAGIAVRLLNVGMGDLFDGGPGLSGVPGREAAFERAFQTAAAAAETLDADLLHIGPSRVPKASGRTACLAVYRRNLAFAVAARERRGLRAALVIEAMNRTDMPDALLGAVDDAAAVVRDGFGGDLRLLFDIYHVAMNGEDVLAAYARLAPLVAHIQYSNIPDRREPGRGRLAVRPLIEGLAAAGYGGWFGAEYRPSVPTAETLDWLHAAPGNAD